MQAYIVDIAYALPQRVETTEDLSRENPTWDMQAIASKAGIHSRRIASADETALDLACMAANSLLSRHQDLRKNIDFLLFCTQTPDYFLPSGACILQHRLGLPRTVGAMDYSLGCSGYVYGLFLADAMIRAGAARSVLLCTGDTYTKFIHPNDRSVRPLFGDAGTASLIVADEAGGGRLGFFELGTNGKGAPDLIVPAGGMRCPRTQETAAAELDEKGSMRSRDNLFMDGNAIFSFALSTVPRLLESLLKKSAWQGSEVDWWVFHQANLFMLKNLARVCKVPWGKMVLSLEDIGNTVSCSIPIALQRYREAGRIVSGQKLMFVGFGVGYSWGACTVEWK